MEIDRIGWIFVMLVWFVGVLAPVYDAKYLLTARGISLLVINGVFVSALGIYTRAASLPYSWHQIIQLPQWQMSRESYAGARTQFAGYVLLGYALGLLTYRTIRALTRKS